VDHEEQPGERADHEYLAVREIEELQHAEDQRVADRDQGIRRPEHQAVDQLLVNHALWCGSCSGSSYRDCREPIGTANPRS
jgi:hypothetical protein